MLIKVKVTPKSSQNKITQPGESFKINPKVEQVHFRIKVTSAPEKGKANQQIIKLLAKYFKVSKSNIEIIRGLTKPNKIVRIKSLKHEGIKA